MSHAIWLQTPSYGKFLMKISMQFYYRQLLIGSLMKIWMQCIQCIELTWYRKCLTQLDYRQFLGSSKINCAVWVTCLVSFRVFVRKYAGEVTVPSFQKRGAVTSWPHGHSDQNEKVQGNLWVKYVPCSSYLYVDWKSDLSYNDFERNRFVIVVVLGDVFDTWFSITMSDREWIWTIRIVK